MLRVVSFKTSNSTRRRHRYSSPALSHTQSHAHRAQHVAVQTHEEQLVARRVVARHSQCEQHFLIQHCNLIVIWRLLNASSSPLLLKCFHFRQIQTNSFVSYRFNTVTNCKAFSSTRSELLHRCMQSRSSPWLQNKRLFCTVCTVHNTVLARNYTSCYIMKLPLIQYSTVNIWLIHAYEYD